jgi:hypothetical protein
MVNAHIIYKQCFNMMNNPMPANKMHCLTAEEFRIEVIDVLVGDFTCRKLPGLPPLIDQPAIHLRRDHKSVNMARRGILKAGRCHHCCLGVANARRVETVSWL